MWVPRFGVRGVGFGFEWRAGAARLGLEDLKQSRFGCCLKEVGVRLGVVSLLIGHL